MMRAGNYLERSERDQALHKQRRRCAHGQRGDGKIFILPVLDALRIKTGERGDAALGATPENPGSPAI